MLRTNTKLFSFRCMVDRATLFIRFVLVLSGGNDAQPLAPLKYQEPKPLEAFLPHLDPATNANHKLEVRQTFASLLVYLSTTDVFTQLSLQLCYVWVLENVIALAKVCCHILQEC